MSVVFPKGSFIVNTAGVRVCYRLNSGADLLVLIGRRPSLCVQGSAVMIRRRPIEAAAVDHRSNREILSPEG